MSAFLGSPDHPKTAGIVCYITIIGWLIAYFALYKNNRDPTAAFHIRQTLLLHLLSLLLNVLSYLALWYMFSPLLMTALALVLFLLWLTGLSGAVAGKKRAVPLIGSLAQRLFRAI